MDYEYDDYDYYDTIPFGDAERYEDEEVARETYAESYADDYDDYDDYDEDYDNEYDEGY